MKSIIIINGIAMVFILSGTQVFGQSTVLPELVFKANNVHYQADASPFGGSGYEPPEPVEKGEPVEKQNKQKCDVESDIKIEVEVGLKPSAKITYSKKTKCVVLEEY